MGEKCGIKALGCSARGPSSVGAPSLKFPLRRCINASKVRLSRFNRENQVCRQPVDSRLVTKTPMWGRRSIAATRRAGAVTVQARHLIALRPSPSFCPPFSSFSSLSSSRLQLRPRPRISIPAPLHFTFTPVRYCSAEVRMMASTDRDTLPDV
jgi:hypothetical protein